LDGWVGGGSLGSVKTSAPTAMLGCGRRSCSKESDRLHGGGFGFPGTLKSIVALQKRRSMAATTDQVSSLPNGVMITVPSAFVVTLFWSLSCMSA